MASANPFETWEKFGTQGALLKVRYWELAEGNALQVNTLGGALRMQMMFVRTAEQTPLSQVFADARRQA